jgi:ABC-2 family transporter protein
LRSLDTAIDQSGASLRPLLAKEIREAISGRALWTMLLLLCPLVGYSFFQAVALYGEASSAARDSPALASGLSPLDGVLVPSLGALYLAVTLMFPFVAIRTLGREKETGALRLLVQLPYRVSTLVVAKMTAISVVWLIAAVPVFLVFPVWSWLGGHLYLPESLNLLFGHLLYGLLVGSIALFAAAISDSAATAAIVTLAFTIGSWVLDFALAGQPGLFDWMARLSLTQTLRSFEQGLLSIGLVLGMVGSIFGFAALAAVWLHPGAALKARLIQTIACVAIVTVVFGIATQLRLSVDLTEDRRNSFPLADQRALAGLHEQLLVSVHLAPEDSRYADFRRNVLAKLERALPNLAVRLVAAGQTIVGSTGDDAYGEIEYRYAGRSAKSRSTSHREVLPIIYELAGIPVPAPIAGEDYPGYPLTSSAGAGVLWFYGVLPILIVMVWWWTRRAPRIPPRLEEGGPS